MHNRQHYELFVCRQAESSFACAVMNSAVDPSSLSVLQATREGFADQPHALARARSFAEPLLMTAELDTGESVLAHADGTAEILRTIGGSQAMQAACYLVYASDYLNKPQEVIAKAFGHAYAELAMATARLIRVQRQARAVRQPESPPGPRACHRPHRPDARRAARPIEP